MLFSLKDDRQFDFFAMIIMFWLKYLDWYEESRIFPKKNVTKGIRIKSIASRRNSKL